MISGAEDHKSEQATGTRDKLLFSALALYAEQGIHGVSLRSISAASGSRNSAAVHYHFGNKLGVIQALIKLIQQELDRIALEYQLPAVVQQACDLDTVIKAVLEVVAELRRSQPWGEDAIQFMSRLLADVDEELAEVINRETGAFYLSADRLLARLLPELDHEARQLRLMFMADNIFHGFAEVGHLQRTPLGDLSQISPDKLLDHLAQYLCAGLRG
jgi:AcrR family transcriptional regulator